MLYYREPFRIMIDKREIQNMNLKNLTFEKKAVLLLLAFYLLAYILPLGFRQMVRPDEFRYAEIPREMLAGGDWVVPRLNGMPYFEKPAFSYQLTALSFKLFGENAFALRLPSALGAGLAALALFLLLYYNSRDKYLPPLGTAIFLTAGLVYGVGTFAVTDGPLNAALTVVMVAFFFAWRSDKRWGRAALLLAVAGLAAGMAFLIKGFLAFAVPVAVIVPFLIWEKQFRRVFIYPWLPFAVCLAVVLPWSLAIYRDAPDFWEYFIVEEHWKRFTDATYDRDPQPFWYFIPVLLGGMMPSGLLWCIAWLGWSGRDRSPDAATVSEGRVRRFLRRVMELRLVQDPLRRYLVCWAVIPFVLFSMSSCKLGTYILPCFAPLAALTAYGVIEALRERKALADKILNWALTIAGCVFAAAGCGGALFLAVCAVPGKLTVLYSDGLIAPLITLALIGAWGLAVWRSATAKRTAVLRIGIFLLGIAPAVFFGLKSIPDAMLGGRATSIGIERGMAKIGLKNDDVVFADRNTFSAANWVLKRSNLYILGRPGELQYSLQKYPEYQSRWFPDEIAAPVLQTTPKGSRVYFGMRNFKKYPIPGEWKPYELVEENGITIVRF